MEIAGGEIFARLGNSSVLLATDGSFKLRVSLALELAVVELDLSLRPTTVPSLANNVAVAPGQSLSWLVVPRLQASGHVRIDTKIWHLKRALAYHDHNWGNFAWGADFAWEWGYGLPADDDCPWTFMFVRLSDRAMARTRTQILTVWRGTQIVRSFRGRQLRFVTGDALSPPDVFRVPPSMALLAPNCATEVPARVVIEAEADGDVFRVELRPRSVAQIIVPNDRSAGTTRINEVSTELRASGRILDEVFDYEGGGVLEVLAP